MRSQPAKDLSPASMDIPDVVVTIQSAMPILGLSYWQARALVLSGEIPRVEYPSRFVKHASERRLRVRLRDVYEFIARRTEPRPTWKKSGKR